VIALVETGPRGLRCVSDSHPWPRPWCLSIRRAKHVLDEQARCCRVNRAELDFLRLGIVDEYLVVLTGQRHILRRLDVVAAPKMWHAGNRTARLCRSTSRNRGAPQRV